MHAITRSVLRFSQLVLHASRMQIFFANDGKQGWKIGYTDRIADKFFKRDGANDQAVGRALRLGRSSSMRRD
jgi:hypothetical protein